MQERYESDIVVGAVGIALHQLDLGIADLQGAAGDASADPTLLHEAVDEGRLAGKNAARFPEAYRRARRTPLGIVFTDPQIAMVGESHAELARAAPPSRPARWRSRTGDGQA